MAGKRVQSSLLELPSAADIIQSREAFRLGIKPWRRCPWASNGASGFYGFCLYWKNIQPTDIYKYACFLYAKLGNANELKEHTAENPVENRNFLGDVFYFLRDNFS